MYDFAASGCDMCFAIGTQHLGCRFPNGPSQNTSRIQHPVCTAPQPHSETQTV